MTNYNDGKWHFWNGGECPVDLRSTVEIVWAFSGGRDLTNQGGDLAGNWIWLGSEHGSIFAFRVIKEHKEPREMWIWHGKVFTNEDCAMREFFQDTSHDHSLRNQNRPFKVREVTE